MNSLHREYLFSFNYIGINFYLLKQINSHRSDKGELIKLQDNLIQMP